MKTKEVHKSSFDEIAKSQFVRVVDVFFIGPFLIYIASQASGISELSRLILYIIGIATIIYNGRNYIENKVKRHIGHIR
jgi:hypothetical protein